MLKVRITPRKWPIGVPKKARTFKGLVGIPRKFRLKFSRKPSAASRHPSQISGELRKIFWPKNSSNRYFIQKNQSKSISSVLQKIRRGEKKKPRQNVGEFRLKKILGPRVGLEPTTYWLQLSLGFPRGWTISFPS